MARAKYRIKHNNGSGMYVTLPVTHEFGCYFHLTDLDFYYAVVS
jgi:hypothetical protein